MVRIIRDMNFIKSIKIISKPGATLEVKAAKIDSEALKNVMDKDLKEYFNFNKALEECKKERSTFETIKLNIYVFLNRWQKVKLLWWIIKNLF